MSEIADKYATDNSFLTLGELEKLPTPRLLAYYKKIRPGLFWAAYDGDNDGGREAYLKAVRKLLNTREHVA